MENNNIKCLLIIFSLSLGHELSKRLVNDEGVQAPKIFDYSGNRIHPGTLGDICARHHEKYH